MTEAAIKGLLKILKAENGFKTLKKHFDRSWTIHIDETKEGRIVFEIEEKDSGSDRMTVQDVAIFLQTDRESVRRMCQTRYREQARFPIPIAKVGAKMIRFNRPDVEAWWKKICESGDTPPMKIVKVKK